MNQEQYITGVRSQYGRILLSKKEAAKELGVSVNGLDLLRNEGRIKFINVGNRVKFNASDLADFMKLEK